MKILLQRVSETEVIIKNQQFSRTSAGLLILFGTKRGDSESSCGILADKALNLRIFEDKANRMNLSALDTNAEIMIVSQFTLYADCKKGRRPAFTEAMEPVEAENLYDKFVKLVSASELTTKTGQFGASMDIKFTNHGPVTIMLEHDV